MKLRKYFYHIIFLLEGKNLILKYNEELANDIVIATFNDNELLYFTCLVLSVIQYHQDIADKVMELILASLSKNNKLSITCNT
ncbi:MAG: hypothetical protein ACTS78_01000 [Arsenophonus sp. NC-WZS1-MAG3]